MTMKKMLATILSVAMILSTMTFSAFAADVAISADCTVNDGDVLSGGTGVEIITVADGATITLNGVNVQRITLAGSATINIADGTTNDVNANGSKDGAVVVPKGSSLTIDGDTGVLNAAKGKMSSYSAAIGSDRWGSVGSVTITINGGVINAEANYAAAIGGGQEMPATVIINGGTINAESNYGAAIGGGQEAAGTVTITDGTVVAEAHYGAAIGGGQESDATVTITGGDITAQGMFGAAIGAGQDSTGETTIAISDATVTASVDPETASSTPSSTRGITSAAIGSSEGTATITITDSEVKAISVNAPAIGGGLNATETSTVTISGTSTIEALVSAPDYTVENAIGNADDATNVQIGSDVSVKLAPGAEICTTVENIWKVSDTDTREAFVVQLKNVTANNALKIETYSGDVLLATTTLRNNHLDDNSALYPVTAQEWMTANVVIWGEESGSWATEWHTKPDVAHIPDNFKVYCDGELAAEAERTFDEEWIATYKALDNVAKVAMIGEEPYATLADAFAAVKANETITLIDDITVTEQTTVTNPAALGGTVTLDGNGKTIYAGALSKENTSVLVFGNVSESKWCLGVDIKDLTIDVDSARYALMFVGGTSSELTNVTITGDYYYGINFYGTHGGTMTNCSVPSIFTNGQSANPLNLVNTTVGSMDVNTGSNDNVKVFIDDDSSVEELVIWGTSTHQVNSLENVGTVKTLDEVPFVAKVGEVLYTSFEEALADAEAGDTIDLMGNTHKLSGTQNTINKNITITNGTFDITDAVCNANSIFYVAGEGVVATFDTVNIEGENYSSAYGVIYVNEGAKAVIENCNFDLKNELYGGGSVLKGNGINVSSFEVTDSTFNLENPSRIIANATVAIDGVTIDAKVTDETLVVGEMNNHAFRNLVGTVNNSTITADGFETGIKNTDGDLSITGTSVITLKNSADTDLVVGSGRAVTVAETARLYAYTSDIADDAVTNDNVIVVKTMTADNITAIADQTYTGSAVEPALEIKDGDYPLVAGTDYTVEYADNTVVGTAKAKVTFIDRYEGTAEVTFNIVAKELTAENIAALADVTYTGEAFEPEVEVKDGDYPLVAGTDYTVEYADNTNAGTATVTVTFKGNYTGVAEKTFEIAKKKINTAVTLTAPKSGEAPQTTIETDEYTAAVTWSPAATYFDYETVYTATIVITPGANYTAEGVGENEYTIEGAKTVTNAADSAEITAEYKKTSYRPLTDLVSADGKESYTVKFDTDGGSTVASVRVTENKTVSEPEAPTKKGYIFEGWYADEALTEAYDFDTKVTGAITLYAKWTEDTSEEDKTDDNKDETQTTEWINPFNDVNTGDWFYESVKYMAESGLCKGTSSDTFEPDTLITRAMMVTMLYRLEGEPAVNRSIPFADVDMSAYYASAVIWAQQNGIVNGVSETEFAPDANITREQIAAIIYRYAQCKGYDVSEGENTNILSYTDAEEISEYAVEAVQYAAGSGLMKGKTASTLNPKDNATRAEIVTIIYRFIEGNK